MIEIRFPTPEGCSVNFVVRGHSGQGPKGFDIVCSAVSVLVMTMLGGLEKELAAIIKGKVVEGCCEVVISVSDEQMSEFQRVVLIFRYGFLRLSQTYPQFVKMVT